MFGGAAEVETHCDIEEINVGKHFWLGSGGFLREAAAEFMTGRRYSLLLLLHFARMPRQQSSLRAVGESPLHIEVADQHHAPRTPLSYGLMATG